MLRGGQGQGGLEEGQNLKRTLPCDSEGLSSGWGHCGKSRVRVHRETDASCSLCSVAHFAWPVPEHKQRKMSLKAATLALALLAITGKGEQPLLLGWCSPRGRGPSGAASCPRPSMLLCRAMAILDSLLLPCSGWLQGVRGASPGDMASGM